MRCTFAEDGCVEASEGRRGRGCLTVQPAREVRLTWRSAAESCLAALCSSPGSKKNKAIVRFEV